MNGGRGCRASAGGRALLAWTDRTGEDAQVVLAFVDAGGQVHGPKPAMEAVGGSKLVGLAASPESAALAWQEPRANARATRAFTSQAVSTAAGRLAAQPVTSVEVASGVNPELVATDSGFALLASAHACMANRRADRLLHQPGGAHLRALRRAPRAGANRAARSGRRKRCHRAGLGAPVRGRPVLRTGRDRRGSYAHLRGRSRAAHVAVRDPRTRCRRRPTRRA